MYVLRPATLEDSSIITGHRYQIYREMNFPDDPALQSMKTAFQAWVHNELGRGSYLAVLVMAGDQVVAGAGIIVSQQPPTYSNLSGLSGYLDNVYTDPAHRGQGLAKQMIEALLEQTRQRGIGMVSLHTSPKARGLYESLGFEAEKDAMRRIDTDIH
jgi:ribosomal protein S18 acetylase RimI-like enzyme